MRESDSYSWYSEHVGNAPRDYWHVTDGNGHRARQHFFSQASADAYAKMLNIPRNL